MGRYLTNGVVTRIEIVKRDDWRADNDFLFKKKLNTILKDISKKLDMSLYELKNEYSNSYEFSLKPEIFDNNIHDLIREMSSLTFPNVGCFMNSEETIESINSKEFIEKYPFKCKVKSDGKYYIEINDDKINEYENDFPLYWIIDDDNLRKNIEVNIYYIPIWFDGNKYDGEYEFNMLKIMNTMKTKYYKNELSKALIYYVTE